MVKYARIIFEEPVPDDITPEEALERLLEQIRDYYKFNRSNIKDVEFSKSPHIRE